MKRRTIKKGIADNLKRVMDNEHDKAVMHNVLLCIHGRLEGKNRFVTIQDPFKDDSLNTIWEFIHQSLDKRGL